MPRRACGTEMKSGTPSLSLSLPLSVSLTPTNAHFSSLLFVKFSLFSCPPPSPPPASLSPSGLLRHHHPLRAFLIVPQIPLCVFIAPFVKLEAPARQAYYYSITGAGHFHNGGLPMPRARSATSHRTADGILYCCYSVIVEAKLHPSLL